MELQTTNSIIISSDLNSDNRRRVFFSYFFDTKNLQTYLNIFQSGIQAKFTNEESNLISHEPWYLNNIGEIRREQIFEGSENFLHKLINIPDTDDEGNPDASLLNVKLKGALAALEGLGKDHYSKRTEANKTNVNINIFKTLDAIERGVFTNEPVNYFPDTDIEGSTSERQVVEVEPSL